MVRVFFSGGSSGYGVRIDGGGDRECTNTTSVTRPIGRCVC